MKTQKGITLIALIITIIVMLILVGVSVSVALNTGLFKTAQGVAKNTEAERINETAISNGSVTVKVGDEEKTFESMEKYIESLKGEKQEEGIKLADPATYKFYFDNQVFLIDADTTWGDVILTFDDEERFMYASYGEPVPENWELQTWKWLKDNHNMEPSTLMIGSNYIHKAISGSSVDYPPWSGYGDSGFGGKIVGDVSTNPSMLYWCGPAEESGTADAAYANAEFIVKLEEI